MKKGNNSAVVVISCVSASLRARLYSISTGAHLLQRQDQGHSNTFEAEYMYLFI